MPPALSPSARYAYHTILRASIRRQAEEHARKSNGGGDNENDDGIGGNGNDNGDGVEEDNTNTGSLWHHVIHELNYDVCYNHIFRYHQADNFNHNDAAASQPDLSHNMLCAPTERLWRRKNPIGILRDDKKRALGDHAAHDASGQQQNHRPPEEGEGGEEESVQLQLQLHPVVERLVASGELVPVVDPQQDERTCNLGADYEHVCRRPVFPPGRDCAPARIGCYVDSPDEQRIYPHEVASHAPHLNSPQWCAGQCALVNMSFAALQMGVSCRCGHIPPAPELAAEDAGECSAMKCAVAPDEDCGGRWRMVVFDYTCTE